MDARREGEPTPMKSRTNVERKSERELVVMRTVDGPARLVFEAWTKPELFVRWWVPKSSGVSLLSWEMDIMGRQSDGPGQLLEQCLQRRIGFSRGLLHARV